MKSPHLISPDPAESHLDVLRPAPMPAALMARLQQARPDLPGPSPAVPRHLRIPAWGLLTAAAAAVVAGGGWLLESLPPQAAADGAGAQARVDPPVPAVTGETMDYFPALESRQQLLSVRDLGVVYDSRKRAVRLMSTTWLDENTYGDPGEKPVMHESRFRHEIVPVLLPTY
jgi:anti-sigma factor RsiW